MNTTEHEHPNPTEFAAAAPSAHPTDPRATRLEQHLLEVFEDLWDNYVDPAEALYDADGTRWAGLGGGRSGGNASGVPFTTEQQLAEIRDQCRALAADNEFAINGHENRIS